MRDTDKYNAPALEKGLDILELLSEQDHGLTQVEIARQLNRSVSEIYRMLVVLRRRRLVDVDPDSDRHYLTTRLFEMANRTPIIARLTVEAAPVMRDLAYAIDESVHLTVQSDDLLLVIAQVDNPGYNVLKIRLGARVPIWETSSGRALMAFQSDARIAEFLAAYPPPAPVEAGRLLKDLAAVRKRGYEQMRSYVIKGVVNVSAPVIGHDGFAVAAMTIPYIERYSGGVPIDECRRKLIEAARILSRAIGGGVASAVP
jgi:DNA-binding IclR family transcriptional regulator